MTIRITATSGIAALAVAGLAAVTACSSSSSSSSSSTVTGASPTSASSSAPNPLSGGSASGSVVVGSNTSATGPYPDYPFYLVHGTAKEIAIVTGSAYHGGQATGVSSDGKLIVGWYADAAGTYGFRWTVGNSLVGSLYSAGDLYASANAVSADGAVVVGVSQSASVRALRWSGTGNTATDISNATLGATSSATGTNQNGSVVVGTSANGPWVWDTTKGARLLSTILMASGVDLSGWTLDTSGTTAVSADGKIVVGGGKSPSGLHSGWIARLP